MAFLLTLNNIYDYKEYKEKAEKENRQVYPWGLYVQVAETLIQAMSIYPDKTPDDAYYQLINDLGNKMYTPDFLSAPPQFKNTDFMENSENQNLLPLSELRNCGTCGGGEVR